MLSPWIKHRRITQEEALTQTLAHHSLSASIKFVQEVFWRSYLNSLEAALEALERNKFRKTDYDEANAGRTGINFFDHW